MASIATTAEGNYSAGGTWAGGVVPDKDDDVTINHDNVGDADVAWRTITLNAKLTLNADATVGDHATSKMTIGEEGEFDSNGTYQNPRIIASENSNPTNKWYVECEDVVGEDSRTLDFSYVEMRGNQWSLGNDDNLILFNGGQNDDPFISIITPPVHTEATVEHPIEGRDTGRVSESYLFAGVLNLSGSSTFDSWLWQRVYDMKKARKRISFFSRHIHLPKCVIERKAYNPLGGIIFKFSISLKEDE